MMNIDQEIFNKVTKHLLTQGARSTVNVGTETKSAYRGQDGRMCAIGCLISDEDYSQEMEGLAVDQIAHKWPGIFQTENRDLLDLLHVIHDDADVEDWPSRLIELAEEYHLQIPKELSN